MLESRTLAGSLGRRLLGGGLLGGGLLGLGLIVLPALPALAQSWPSDSGLSGDLLGTATRQFERLSPPPVEANGRSERVIPDMPVSDVPGASVDVGRPTVVSAPLSTLRRPTRRASPAAAPTSRFPASRSRPQGREGDLRRELREQDRRIQDLQRQLDQMRQTSSGSRGGGSGLVGVSPAAAATVTPR